MDRDWLEAQLAAGRSIESIAREVGKHPSTVGYWVKKHGLRSQHAERHAARGGLARETLEPLVLQGCSLRAIAERLDVSYATVQHWVRRYDLTTVRAARLKATASARLAGDAAIELLARSTGARCSYANRTADSGAAGAGRTLCSSDVGTSRRCWSRRQAGAVRSAATTGPRPRCSSIT
jgi:transposase